jgi:hypothetical protein
MEKAIDPHAPEALGEHMAQQQPEEFSTRNPQKNGVTLVVLAAKGHLTFVIRENVFFWQDTAIQITPQVDQRRFPCAHGFAIHHPFAG